MKPFIDYYVWLNSDWAYLGAERFRTICDELDVQINLKPVDLPYVYSQTGGIVLEKRAKARQDYRIAELKRWTKRLGININFAPKYMCPNADLASCLVIAVDEAGEDAYALHEAILRAEWVEERDISSPDELQRILKEQGLDETRYLEQANNQNIVAKYRKYTQEAIEQGVFGSPFYVYEDELFWGQDRLGMLRETIEDSLSR